MKITPFNYIATIQKVGAENLPEEIRQAHAYLMQMTGDGKDWSKINSDATVKSIADLAFEKLGEFMSHQGLSGKEQSPNLNQARKFATDLIALWRFEQTRPEWMESFKAQLTFGKTELLLADHRIKFTRFQGKPVSFSFDTYDDLFDDSLKVKQNQLEYLYNEDDELKKQLIGQFLELENKVVSISKVNSLRDRIRRAVLGGKILNGLSEKTPTGYIHGKLEEKYWDFTDRVKVIIRDEIKNQLELFIHAGTSPVSKVEKEVMKKFVELAGKSWYSMQVELVLGSLQMHIRNEAINKKSAYAEEIMEIQRELVRVVNGLIRDRKKRKVNLNKALVEKIKRILFSKQHKPAKKTLFEFPVSETKTLQGINPVFPEVINSVDLGKMEFTSLGFTGKWLTLMGNPCAGFTVMIFGKPKMGKSYLAVDFAGYLARNFGKVLYVAKEEKFGMTFSTKLKDQDAAHENLIISESLPEDLSGYDFIFLDSINSLKLTPEDLRSLKEKNPGKSFIYIFQTTKGGNFRGENTFQHDVDSVIEIPERGKAVQFGRFNQGGEIAIFGDQPAQPVQELDGTSKNGKKKKIVKADFDPEMYSPNEDDNPRFMFSTTHTILLVHALKKDFDVYQLMRKEMAKRGLDENGKWVGFEKAKKIHLIKS